MSQTFGSQGTLEERFAHILQPIRDLAKNWDVDIAHFLEEYLEDLEKIEITFDDGATTMNFSEAALLIQGSAGVYAKKVEYLYTLVFQVLDLVTQKKKANGTSGEDGAGGDGEQGDTNDQFLPLDDIPDTEGSYTKEQGDTSNKNVRPVPEMPTRLIPLEESEKGDNALYNKKGEVMGNHCDFNIDIGYISVDGSLLLEMRDKALLSATFMQQQMLHVLVEENMDCDLDDVNSRLPLTNEDNDDGPSPVEDYEAVVGDGGDIRRDATNEHVVTGAQRRRVTFARPQAKTKQVADPWLLLDPHAKSKAVEKPLRKKKPFKIPPGIDDTSKKRKKIKVKTELPPVDEVVEKLFSHRLKFPKNRLKVPDFPELEDAFWHEYKLREEIKLELKKECKEQFEVVDDDEGDDCNEEGLQGDPVDNNDDDDVDDIPLLQLDADLISEHGRSRWTDVGNSGHDLSLRDDITLSYEDLVQKHVEKFLASAAEYAQITELSRRVSEWEEKIKPKLEEQEGHKHFDIHKYGTYIIELLVRGERRAFKELVRGKPEYEICRYTLATLQLANVYNVELSVIPDLSGNIMDCLYVTLLSTKRHFEELEEYRVPSIQEL